MQVIEKMVEGIRGCATASGAVAVMEVLTTVGKVPQLTSPLLPHADTGMAFSAPWEIWQAARPGFLNFLHLRPPPGC